MRNPYIFGIVMIAALLTSPLSNASQTKFNSDQVQAIQQIVHDYLVNNPEVLVEASQVLQKKQLNAMTQKVETTLSANASQLFDDTNKPIAGNPKGDVTLVEFFDYQCPHCKTMGPVVASLIKANPNLKVIFAELPIFGKESQYAAKAALASLKQNKYYAFHTALTNHSYPLPKDAVLKIAKATGLDIKQLQKDMRDPAVDQQIKDNFALAQKTQVLNIGTPTFLFGNLKKNKFQFIPGLTDQATLQKAVDAVK